VVDVFFECFQFFRYLSIEKTLFLTLKNIWYILYFILFPLFGFTQSLEIVDLWHYQKGDIHQDSLREIIKKNKIHLKYNEVINLQFESQVTNNQIINYKYRILNTEKHTTWREIGSQAMIQFPLLDGGNYTLEISSKETPSKISFRLPISVEKTFWQELWFLLSVVVYLLFLLGIAIYFFFLYNLRQKLKLQDVRNRIAADLHDEVGSNLNSIAIFVELLRKQAPPDLLPILDKITNNSAESVELMQDTVWAIQAKNDNFQKFMDKMRGFATEVLAAKGISLSFDNQVDSKKNLLTMEQRKNAYLMYKEAINNIAKHSKASKAIVRIWQEENQICIKVEDNGCGFDTKNIYEGNGLQNFETRAEAHEMQYKLHSEIDKGTCLTLKIFTD
jgi:signal transduction histidine kinase